MTVYELREMLDKLSDSLEVVYEDENGYSHDLNNIKVKTLTNRLDNKTMVVLE